MSLLEFFTLMRRNILFLTICVVLALGVAAGLLSIIPVTYTASASAYVRVAIGDSSYSETVAGYNQAAQAANQKVKVFVPVFTSEVVAQGVVDSLHLNMSASELASRVTASNAPSSLIIEITATADSSSMAQTIADEVVRQGAKQVRTLEGESSPIQVILMSSSALAAPAKSPSVKRFMSFAALIGFIVGYVIVFIRQLLDRKVRTLNNAAEALEASALGWLPISKNVAAWGRDYDGDTYEVEENLRRIRANLRYSNVDGGLNSFLVTSAVQGEGKSTLARHLARVMALAGTDVVLIEADLRRPVFRERFSIPKGRPGLAQILIGAVSLDSALWPTDIEGLSVLPAGYTPPNPSELLGSQRMRELVEYLARDHLVILDAPPVLPVSDAIPLAQIVDGVVVVAAAGSTTLDNLRSLAESIRAVNASLLGVIVNKVRTGLSANAYGYPEYGYYRPSYYAYSKSSRRFHAGLRRHGAGRRRRKVRR